MTLRMATSDDAAGVAAVYLPYVRDTAISFETQQPSVEEMRSRLTTTLATLPWLVITDGPRVKGYAYASPHRAREAYRWSVDVSLYLDASIHRQGQGRRLYTALLNLLGAQGYINAYAASPSPTPPASACMRRWPSDALASSLGSDSNSNGGGTSVGGIGDWPTRRQYRRSRGRGRDYPRRRSIPRWRFTPHNDRAGRHGSSTLLASHRPSTFSMVILTRLRSS
ncbi:hypothetical protein D522_00551 [Mycobacterium avium subsp. paratuberculosis S5]|nr:hypothetical protein D522_00551 [Mycobacterium avium subsp. paratuberculosis S5]